MSNTMWKKFELEIAKWFGTKRNMGSGSINSTDTGDPRHGDIILPEEFNALVECKTRKEFPKSGCYQRAAQTRKEAIALGKAIWFHFERKNGSKQIYILATTPEYMEKICKFLKEELERSSSDNHTV